MDFYYSPFVSTFWVIIWIPGTLLTHTLFINTITTLFLENMVHGKVHWTPEAGRGERRKTKKLNTTHDSSCSKLARFWWLVHNPVGKLLNANISNISYFLLCNIATWRILCTELCKQSCCGYLAALWLLLFTMFDLIWPLFFLFRPGSVYCGVSDLSKF